MNKTTNFENGRAVSLATRCRTIILVAAAGAMAWALPLAASAQTCVQDEFGKSVQCTANDVSIAEVTHTRNFDGTPITTCNIGQRISFVATYKVVTTSTSSRSNIGLYFATDDQASAVSGPCYDNIIPPPNPDKTAVSLNNFCTGPGTPFAYCTGNLQGTSTATIGSSNYQELDVSKSGSPTTDNCGDGGAGSTQYVDVVVQNVICEPTSITDAHLRLPNCTTWQVPGQTIQCDSPAPTYPWVKAAIPGTGSKCNCGVLAVPIIVQNAKIGVTKTANPTTLSGTDGGTSNYTVVVTNNSNLGGVTVNQLCDDKYGNIATASTSPAQHACNAGTLCIAPNNVAGTTCASGINCTLPATLSAPGDTVTCSFNGTVPENSVTTDTVTANAVDQSNNALSGTASATVTAGDAPSSAATVKTLVGAQSACYTIRYGVDVQNKSGGEEVLSLSALNDSAFGPLTTTSGNAYTNNSIVGTTCGQAPTVNNLPGGLGTLSGSAGAGLLPASIAVGGDYKCQFDGVVCGTAASIANGTNSTCIGVTHTNTITSTLTGDEGEAVSPNTPGTLVVEECLSEFHQ